MIKIHPTETKFHYQLHKSNLAIAVPKLQGILNKRPPEDCQQLRDATEHLKEKLLVELVSTKKIPGRKFALRGRVSLRSHPN
jgi:hypothetical protein